MGDKRSRRTRTSSAIMICVVTTIAYGIAIGFSYRKGGENEDNDLFDTSSSEINPISRARHRPLHPPPGWGQKDAKTIHSGVLSNATILLMVTTHNHSIIERSIEDILKATEGSGMNLIACLQDPSRETIDLLKQYPVKIHIAEGSVEKGQENKERSKESSRLEGDWGLRGRLFEMTSFLQKFKNLVGVGDNDMGVCVRDPISPSIKILKTKANDTQTEVYFSSLENEEVGKGGTPYRDHPYSPIYRRAIKNGGGDEGGQDSQPGDKRGDGGNEESPCRQAEVLKEALNFALRNFPRLQHLLLMETAFILSPSIVRYFEQTVKVFEVDPSVYCISAHNPLGGPNTSGDPSTLHRFDHFVSRGSLVPRKLVEEIVRDFVVYEETSHRLNGNSLDILQTWLSWWSRKKRRACIVPNVPRICPMIIPERKGELNKYNSCFPETIGIDVKDTRILHYQYSQDLYHDMMKATPLGVEEKDCRKKNFFPEKMNTSEVYAIYIKMESYDDDFTLHHVMECLGLDLPSAVGYFEGVFKLTYRQAKVLIMAIPYSRFAPGIKDPNALIMARIGDRYTKDSVQYLRNKNQNFTFTSLEVTKIVV